MGNPIERGGTLEGCLGDNSLSSPFQEGFKLRQAYDRNLMSEDQLLAVLLLQFCACAAEVVMLHWRVVNVEYLVPPDFFIKHERKPGINDVPPSERVQPRGVQHLLGLTAYFC